MGDGGRKTSHISKGDEELVDCSVDPLEGMGMYMFPIIGASHLRENSSNFSMQNPSLNSRNFQGLGFVGSQIVPLKNSR